MTWPLGKHPAIAADPFDDDPRLGNAGGVYGAHGEDDVFAIVEHLWSRGPFESAQGDQHPRLRPVSGTETTPLFAGNTIWPARQVIPPLPPRFASAIGTPPDTGIFLSMPSVK
ncbi:MAG TPA: hypothetical protein VM364_23470 [Vicinamibacterales bacterium]|nr:hypothetical protein [Vicinamibacterales bacterium]